jgi:5-methyltetrahydropteroyltriglutamate--homocysteine methyltransferase
MKHSTERILTTHSGRLPRPESLAQLILAKEQGKMIEVKELADNVHSAVAEVVKR